jgi:heterodisulfide reductase subunit B
MTYANGTYAKYAYYPGCSLHASAKEYDTSWRAVCERLGIELAEMADWSCCGTVHATTVDRTMSVALAARNLAIAEAMELDVIAPCSGCFKNLRTADEALKRDGELRQEVNASLPRPIRGSGADAVAPGVCGSPGYKTSVHHPLYVIAGSDRALDDIGLGEPEDLPRPLRGLAVAPYYGCVLTRPASSAGFEPLDDPEDPQSLDRLLSALGADVVPFEAKTKCCGGAVLVSHTDVALDLSGQVLKQAKEAGAECLVVACPMCQMALDAYQSKIERQMGEQMNLPILYFTQLMGLAMGIDERRLGLGRLFVSPARVLAQV